MLHFLYYIIFLVVSLYGVATLANLLRGKIGFIMFIVTELIAGGILLYVWKVL